MIQKIEAGMLATQKKFDAKAKGKHGEVTLGYEAGRGREFITLLIGAKAKTDEMPTRDQLDNMMANTGWFSGELVTEVFGDAGFKKLEKYLHKKWSSEKA